MGLQRHVHPPKRRPLLQPETIPTPPPPAAPQDTSEVIYSANSALNPLPPPEGSFYDGIGFDDGSLDARRGYELRGRVTRSGEVERESVRGDLKDDVADSDLLC